MTKRLPLEARVRAALDAWFGTVARYVGLALLVYSFFVDKLRNPGLLPAATALILLKNVSGVRGGE